ncbi:MAG: Methylenetetrahydrofolate reductase [Frondihabitans sp.]|nr:Methylenetetrahydrofolate reductase [Frondihabitans sp.]
MASSDRTVSRELAQRILSDFSLEMTGKDLHQLAAARESIPAGTRINITFLGNEDLSLRVTAAIAIKDAGFVPVPHIAARRLPSAEMLEEFLTALEENGVSRSVFVVGGDPASPEGPYSDSLDVLKTGLLGAHGVSEVGISGYPEGHPYIDDGTLWSALERKRDLLDEQGIPGVIVTQFGFDVDRIASWVEEVRGRGIDLPLRIGVPGPAGVRRLLSYASRFGVGTSAGIAKKYGFSITNLLGTAGPGTFINSLAERHDRERYGDLKLHFYTFGGLKATSEWAEGFRGEA